MKRLITTAILGPLALATIAACVPLPPPPPPPPPPPAADKAVIGDSEASLVADAMPSAANDAVGGTTACDTASDLPAVGAKVLIHNGGHSWGQYDAATWQRCTLTMIDHYLALGKQVFVATAPTPMAIYCADPFDVALAEAAGNPHTSGDLGYELRQRLEDANAWKLGQLPGLRPQVKLVDWRGLAHYGAPDCTHFTPEGAQQAAAIAQQRGF